MKKHEIQVVEGAKASFHNNVGFCIGTGRMGLALQQEYQEQLRLVQEEIGFSHIRGHGLFCDDMAIYQEYEEDGVRKVEYNYTYLDMVMDSYRRLGLAPFLELGFMPEKLASGTQTVFYWKGNVTPPKSYEAWTAMVQKLLLHLMDRYGKEEVLTWPIEVWNEPNLSGFWENADMQEYFKLFQKTFLSIKEIDERFPVGGPAVCGGTDEIWIKAFLDFCSEQKLAIDFVTRHHYTTEPPVRMGHYGYPQLSSPEDGFVNLQTTRTIIDSFPEYRGLEIHVTEFNTSYIPNCPLHDTNENAAYIAGQLSRLGDVNESYSYWTFGDIFEENGVPFSIFHGGFGLVANGCVPKPTFWTFAFYKRLQESGGTCVYKDDQCVVLQKENGSYLGIAWNWTKEEKGALELAISLPAKSERYTCLTKTVDEKYCNPLKVWHDLGEPARPDASILKLLRESAKPLVRTQLLESPKDCVQIQLSLDQNAVIFFTLQPVEISTDRGYEYNYQY